MVIGNEKVRRERSPFTLQFEINYEERQTVVSCSESLLQRPKYRPKATRNGQMELIFAKRTQASIYSSATVGFARNSTYGFLLPFDVTFMYVQFLMNARNSFRFSPSIYRVIWWNKRECHSHRDVRYFCMK